MTQHHLMIHQDFKLPSDKVYSLKKIYHYKDADYEVDFVLEQSNTNIIGIEVKSSTNIKSSELRGLVKLAQNSGELFKGGVIFYMGEHIVPMQKGGYKFLVLPISLSSIHL